jgi:hypothetical protein
MNLDVIISFLAVVALVAVAAAVELTIRYARRRYLLAVARRRGSAELARALTEGPEPIREHVLALVAVLVLASFFQAIRLVRADIASSAAMDTSAAATDNWPPSGYRYVAGEPPYSSTDRTVGLDEPFTLTSIGDTVRLRDTPFVLRVSAMGWTCPAEFADERLGAGLCREKPRWFVTGYMVEYGGAVHRGHPPRYGYETPAPWPPFYVSSDESLKEFRIVKVGVCDGLGGQERVDCLRFASSWTENDEYCAGMSGDDARYCWSGAAERAADASLCDRIPRDDRTDIWAAADFCRHTVALRTNDPTPCAAIHNPSRREACYEALVPTISDRLCDHVSTPKSYCSCRGLEPDAKRTCFSRIITD